MGRKPKCKNIETASVVDISEPKSTDQAHLRSLKDIDTEYQRVCIHFGDLTLKNEQNRRQLEVLQTRARELFNERMTIEPTTSQTSVE